MLLVSGCAIGTPGAGGGAESSSDSPAAAPQGQEKLARFYTQKVEWSDCGDTKPQPQCAWVEVPVDYDKPDGDTIRLRVLKVPAKGKRQGSLLVNPGGPGGSAVDYARAADYIVSPTVRKAFDVVGFDPRGVGESAPVECVGPAELDGVLGLDPTPDDAAELEKSRTVARNFGAACEKKYPTLLPHLSTVEAAKDMDIVRGVLGDEKLTYLGKSYGTFLGATYAGLFPQRAGHLVLDGAIAPELTADQLNLGQAEGFERATRAYVEACIKGGDCPLGSDVDTAMKALRDLLTSIDAKPLPVEGDPRIKELTEGWASTGFARAMYDPEAWYQLTDAIRAAQDGDGKPLFELANQYADRDPETGAYAGNIMQVISAVNCLDRPSERVSDDEAKARVEKFRTVAPTWGESMAQASISCEEWPVKSGVAPAPIKAEGAGPIVVVGTTRDPATPYEWAQKLAKELADGRLVTFDGDGHTAYMRSNDCVTDAVDGFLVKGKAPEDGLRC